MNKPVRYYLFLVFLLIIAGCAQEDSTDNLPFIILKQGSEFTSDGSMVPVGGQMRFGISAVGGGAAITDLRVKRITESEVITELDRGMFVESGGLDTTLIYIKSDADSETWNIFIMNNNRDTAFVTLTVLKGEGSAYGEIRYYPTVIIGFQSNQQYQHYLDLDSGIVYSSSNVQGNEDRVDLAGFYYITSGRSSPTLTCPGYPSAVGYYPEFNDWPVKNSTSYDYKSVDNDLISSDQFEAATNDSLLVAAYQPQNVSGLCKFCYTGKIVPFKTSGGKYGLIKVIRADEEEGGSMEMAIKIQK